MPQHWIPTAFIRGGTSKGLFFHKRDLPNEQTERDALFLSALGSPDPYGRQLDGMGGGLSSLSKVMIIEASSRPDADVDYTFGQVAVGQPLVDYAANCGNLSSAVGPFAVDEGLVDRPDGQTEVRLYNTNTGKVIVARFMVHEGVAETGGNMHLPGVPGTGSRVELKFLSPGGSRTGKLLPTGAVTDLLSIDGQHLSVSLVDAANPVVILAAGDVGLDGSELPEQIEACPEVMTRLDKIRRAGGVAMGIGASPEAVPASSPKIAVLGQAQDYSSIDGSNISAADYDLSVRMVSMERVHRAVTGTGALGLAVASQMSGTLAHNLAEAQATGSVRLGTPSGVLSVSADVVAEPEDGWTALSASLFRTSRRLMRGEVAVPVTFKHQESV